MTSRSDPGDPLFRRLSLCRLEQLQINKILSEKGILPPENMEIFDLFSFPMMLSMYIRAVQDGERQLRLDSRKQLLDDYFDAVLQKEIRSLPAGHPMAYGYTAAVTYLLPEIAARTAKTQHALTDQELMPLIERSFKELSKRAITVVHPEWIGHVSELRLGSKTADEWYGKAVLDILWKRMGLLVRDEHGAFHIIHQVIEEYLKGESDSFHKKFDLEKARERNWMLFAVITAVAAASTWFALFNYNRNLQLERQKQSILRNESVSLASSSSARLEKGHRDGALKDALAALPSSENERPYVASAERALADALYLYKKESYYPAHLLEWENEPVRCALDRDGSHLITVDEYGRLICIDCGTGGTLWESSIQEAGDSDRAFWADFYSGRVYEEKTDGIWENTVVPKDYVFPVLRSLEDSQTVFCAGESGDAVLLSQSSGEEIWRINYEELPYDSFTSMDLADVSHDEKTVVLGMIWRYQNEPDNASDNFDYRKILLFFDRETGRLTHISDPIFPGTDGLCFFTGKGAFSQDDRTYTVLINDIGSKDNYRYQYLVTVDVGSGKITGSKRTEVRGDEDKLIVCGLIRAELPGPAAVSEARTVTEPLTDSEAQTVSGLSGGPETQTVTEPLADSEARTVTEPLTGPEAKNVQGSGETTSGTFYYYCEYDSCNSNEGTSGSVQIGFLPDGSETWQFSRTFDRIGRPNTVPKMYVIDGSLFLISGNDIVQITQTGSERRVSVEQKVIYSCFDEYSSLRLVFDNGQAGTLYF